MALLEYSGGETSKIGAGVAATTAGRKAIYQFASPETAALGLRLFTPYWGRATVLNGATTVAVVFDEPRESADYIVIMSFDEIPGAATDLYPTDKTAAGFTINVDLDPTADTDIAWMAIG